MPNGSPFVLPQFQGSLYDVQRQQALAQALSQQAMAPQQNTSAIRTGEFSVVPKYSPLGGIAQLGQAYLANALAKDASQNQNQLGQNQWNSLTGQGGVGAMSSALGAVSGGNSSPLQSASADQPVNDGTAGASGVSQQLSQQPQQQSQGMLAPGGPLNPLGMPVQQAAMMLMSSPEEYWKTQAGAYKQADIVPQLRAAGIDPNSDQGHALARALIDKNNYVAPITGTGIMRNPFNPSQPVAFNPEIPAGSQPLFDASGNVARVQPIQGAQGVMQGNAAATAAGEGSALPYAGVDAQGNPLPITNRTQAARGYVGSQPPPIPTVPGLTGNTGISKAPSDVPLPGGAAPGGAIYAAPPMGAQANAEATARGQIDTMQRSYQNLQTVRSGAPAALQDVDNMSKLAAGASPVTLGASGAKFAGLFSPNAAEYEKSRDNLVTNLGSQLGINSDAARDLVYGSIPSYGAPKQAVQNGLETLRGQIQTRLLKSDYLSGAYASGDAKAYNQRENQFDQNINPAAANQIAKINSMPSGPQKADALRALKGKPSFEWAASNGILK